MPQRHQPLNLLEKQIEPASEKKVELYENTCVLAKGNDDTIYVRNNTVKVVMLDADIRWTGQHHFYGEVQKIFFSEKTPKGFYVAVKSFYQ